jgi:hypothetical protein
MAGLSIDRIADATIGETLGSASELRQINVQVLTIWDGADWNHTRGLSHAKPSEGI